MLITESKLRKIVQEVLLEATPPAAAGAAPAAGPVTSTIKKGNGGYEYEIFSNGKIQIVKKAGKQLPTPIILNQKQALAVAKEQVQLGNKGTTVAQIASGTLVFNPAAAPAQPAAAPAGSTSPAALQAMATFLSSIASKLTVDSLCAPNVMPLWVYPFVNFLVLRKTPLVLTNAVYLQSLHRICDIARARGSANLAGPGDIATAQDRDPTYSKDKQGIVGADVSFAKDWSKGYDYTSTNPYMHIAMSLTNFSFSGPPGGPYTITDTYDFNEPGKVDAPLGNPNYMLQQAVARNQFLKTVSQTFQTKGIFGGIEDLMRYYEATLNYGGFQITGTTVVPQGYVPPKARAKK
jgi:hypothetical protein